MNLAINGLRLISRVGGAILQPGLVSVAGICHEAVSNGMFFFLFVLGFVLVSFL